MASIYDILYEDIKKFLDANGKSFKDEDDAYNKALILLKDRKTIGHTISIIEWMMAHNLLINKVDIPNYTSRQIDNMTQNQINSLAKLLTMTGNDIKNIKNILRYLGKLDIKNKILLPEINASIFGLLNDLEAKEVDEINFDTMTFDDAINLLKTHRNKTLIRKSIYDNLEKIIFYNLLDIKLEYLGELSYFRHLRHVFPKSLVLELIKINQKKLLKKHTVEKINESIDLIKQDQMNVLDVELYQDITKLENFLINLIEIKEIGLAKKVFHIANEYNFRAQIGYSRYSFNEHLTQISVNQKDDVFNTLLEFIGDEDFIKRILNILVKSGKYELFMKILNILVQSGKYELFMKILNLLITKNYRDSRGAINLILPRLQKAIESNNNNLLIKYLDIVNYVLDGKLRLGGYHIKTIENMIKAAEQDSS